MGVEALYKSGALKDFDVVFIIGRHKKTHIKTEEFFLLGVDGEGNLNVKETRNFQESKPQVIKDVEAYDWYDPVTLMEIERKISRMSD